MNNDLGKRLKEFRVYHQLSESELAEKLNVDVSLIFNWENAKEEPKIDELIFLSKLYKVSLDDLINTKRSVKSCYSDDVHIGKDGIHVSSDDGSRVDISFKDGVHVHSNECKTGYDYKNVFNMNRKLYYRYKGTAVSLLTLVIIVAFLLMGFLIPNNQGWICGWTLFLLIPFTGSIFDVIYSHKPSRLFIPALVIGIYCLLGLAGPKIWHPTWVIFFIIPIYYIICGFFEHKNN